MQILHVGSLQQFLTIQPIKKRGYLMNMLKPFYCLFRYNVKKQAHSGSYLKDGICF